jgi:hypothetical protein
MATQHEAIEQWTENAIKLRWLHDSSYRYYKGMNDQLFYTSIILTTFTGIAGFGIATTSSYTPYVLASMNIMIGLLLSVQKFIRAAENSEAHANASRHYASFIRSVAMEMNMHPSNDEYVDFVKYFKNDYARLCSISPDVPNKIIKQFKSQFSNIIYTDIESTHPSVVRMLTKVTSQAHSSCSSNTPEIEFESPGPENSTLVE